MSQFSKIKIQIANVFPFLSRWNRYIKAAYFDSSAIKKSYSQHGEDVFVWETLNRTFPGRKYNFVDVGGFHPVLLSNTYLLYRKKMAGVVIEPNRELLNLHKMFRRRDEHLEIACSRINSLEEFHFQSTFPALSSLKKVNTKRKIESRFVPVLNLDTIYDGLELKRIYFLSVDVEGFDLEVLQGAEKTLRNTFLICIECDSEEIGEQITTFLKQRNFIFKNKFGCNLIFINDKFDSNIT